MDSPRNVKPGLPMNDSVNDYVYLRAKNPAR